MRDAQQISAREVSQGVQRHVLDQTTWFGSTVRSRCHTDHGVCRSNGSLDRVIAGLPGMRAGP
ncbi:hypothetical protein ABZ208_38275, partial [Streptomyces sp. NPDC006208]|uniref:hypothetical protein n=1 Tax=Streptomyces sp. NPDC006208 TaxID=3156734 RepID=UPI0033A8C6BB